MTPANLLWIVGAFLLALGVLIVVHELGHYVAARLCNVKVLRFSIGFGKPLWLRRCGGPDGTEWVLAAFPLGGYVRMLDEREGEVPPHELARAFNRQSVWRRSVIVAAGPLANLLLAVVIYWCLLMAGVEEPRHALADLPAVIGDVLPAAPAARAGLQPGDRVVAVDGAPIATWHELARAIRATGPRPLTLAVQRDAAELTLQVTPEDAGGDGAQPHYRIGIAVYIDPQLRHTAAAVVRYGPLDALLRAFAQTWDTAHLSLRMIGRMLLGEMSVKNISGPVTIADYAGQSARMGADYYLRFIALVSISLGVLNLLPIPLLDGGHLMYYLAEIIKGGPLSERVMEIGQQIGLMLLALLMALAFYNDINRLISG